MCICVLSSGEYNPQVAGIFHDASIGNAIHIILVRLILLHGEEVAEISFIHNHLIFPSLLYVAVGTLVHYKCLLGTCFVTGATQ